MLKSDSGSFRDPANRVYTFEGGADESVKIYRGVNKLTLEQYRTLSQMPFFRALHSAGKIVSTSEAAVGGIVDEIIADGWHGVLEHTCVPFITYPYEWTFTMLKDAALLHLEILEDALEAGWTLKDSTPYNIQWVNAQPVFIDIPSFEPREVGEPWNGYRQFCSMFMVPLMLRSHLGIDHLPILRSYLDGIPPPEAIKFFSGRNKFKKGVMSHVYLPAKVEGSIQKKERDGVEVERRTSRGHSHAMVIGLVQSMRRLIKSLNTNIRHTDWSQYDQTHSYDDKEHDEKKAFVETAIQAKPRKLAWDIGCNTGTFSEIAARHADRVVALDGDHDAVEKLYLRLKSNDEASILPLVMNLANISPNQGWGGRERAALDNRSKPEMVLVLALIHHIRISANIPNAMFLSWLHSLGAEVVIEFVTRKDEMVVKLLTYKTEQYDDYNLEQFVSECEELFDIVDRQDLKNGKRVIFHLTPKV